MFGKNEKKTEEAKANVNYDIKVEKVRRTKNDSILMVDLIVNGVWIKSCMLKKLSVKKMVKSIRRVIHAISCSFLLRSQEINGIIVHGSRYLMGISKRFANRLHLCYNQVAR